MVGMTIIHGLMKGRDRVDLEASLFSRQEGNGLDRFGVGRLDQVLFWTRLVLRTGLLE